MRLPVRGLRRLRAGATGDEGITLLEVVISLLIIAVVMSSAAGFFINGLRSTGGQSSRQVAISLTNQQLETVTAIPANQLLTGRTSAAVTALLATDTGGVLTGRDDTSNSTTASYDYDPTATAASTPTVPTTTTVKQNNVSYTIRTFIDPCWLPTGTSTSTNATRNLACVASSSPPSGAPSVSMEYRVTVATGWVGGPSTNCAGGCSFNDSTIIDPNSDPAFNSNISQPTLTGVTPTPVGASSSQLLTLTGTNFVSGASVTIACTGCSATVGAIDQTTNTGSSIKVPVTFGAGSGTATIRLTNPDGGTAVIALTVNPPPVITTYSPAFVGAGTPTTVTVTGTGLAATPSVTATGGTVGLVTYAAGSLSFSYTGTSSTPSPVFTVTNPDGGTTTFSGINVVGGATVVSFTPVTARYVMLNITQFGAAPSSQAGTYYAQLAEMQVFSSASATTNLALGRGVTGNNDLGGFGWYLGLLTDGVTNTNNALAHGWTTTGSSSQTASPPAYVVIDLGSVQTVGSVTLWGRTDLASTTGGTASFPAHFTIQVSSTSPTAGFTTVSSQ